MASVTFLNGIEIGNSYFKSSKRDFLWTLLHSRYRGIETVIPGQE